MIALFIFVGLGLAVISIFCFIPRTAIAVFIRSKSGGVSCVVVVSCALVLAAVEQ
jgi:hypothetical protein